METSSFTLFSESCETATSFLSLLLYHSFMLLQIVEKMNLALIINNFLLDWDARPDMSDCCVGKTRLTEKLRLIILLKLLRHNAADRPVANEPVFVQSSLTAVGSMSFKSTNYLSIPSFAVQGAMLLVVVREPASQWVHFCMFTFDLL